MREKEGEKSRERRTRKMKGTELRSPARKEMGQQHHNSWDLIQLFFLSVISSPLSISPSLSFFLLSFFSFSLILSPSLIICERKCSLLFCYDFPVTITLIRIPPTTHWNGYSLTLIWTRTTGRENHLIEWENEGKREEREKVVSQRASHRDG